MEHQKKVLFLLDNCFTNDRRVYREAKALVDNNYEVLLVAVKRKDLPLNEDVDGIKVLRLFDNDIYDIKKNGCFKKYAKYLVSNHQFEAIHANDQIMLHLGVKIKSIKPDIKLIYDSHEMFYAWPLNTNAKGWIYLKSLIVRYLLKKREARNIKKIDRLITVNESIRKSILAFYKLNLTSAFIRNIPEIPEIKPNNILRSKYNLNADDKILVYIGANIYPKTINIEQVIKEFSNKKGVYMIFICADNWGRKEVKSYADGIGVNNLFFHDLIPVHDIPDYLAGADVGILSSWNKKDLSYWYGLDNKLFEYMMSEIPILGTQQPEYINIIEKYKIGLCINPDEENYFGAFLNILENYSFYKENLIKAKKVLNWENESKVLVNFYQNLLNP